MKSFMNRRRKMKKFVNILTITRIIATLILPIVWYFTSGMVVVLFVLFILFTDFFDGLLARIFKVQTLFGSLTDTIADKVFGIAVMLLIASQIPLFYLLVLTEVMIACINIASAFKGATIKSSFIGRAKMWLLGASNILGLLYILCPSVELLSITMNDSLNIVHTVVFITCGAEIMVIIDYAMKLAKSILNKKDKVSFHLKKKEEIKRVLFDTEYYTHHKTRPFIEHLCK